MNIEMVKDDLKIAKIKVVGVGGGGCNAINRMIESDLRCVEFIAINTDAQVLAKSRAEHRLQIGTQLTKGLGAGSNPEVGQKSAQEDRELLLDCLKGSDMVFITAGMGGGTGTGAAPIVAEIAKEIGALTLAIVTKPFKFEGPRRMKQADQGISLLQKNVDAIITIPNQNVLGITDKDTNINDTWLMVDDVLRQAVQGISDIITVPGEINVDFADVKTIMSEAGNCLMGIGRGSGDNRAVEAATKAISNPLIENVSMDGAKSILVNVTRGNNLSIHEYDEIVSLVTNSCDKDANIIAGIAVDPSIENEVRVTVIATGFNQPQSMRNDRIRRSEKTNLSISTTPILYPDEKPKPNLTKLEPKPTKPVVEEKEKATPDEKYIKDFDTSMFDEQYKTPAIIRKKDVDFDNYDIPALIRIRTD